MEEAVLKVVMVGDTTLPKITGHDDLSLSDMSLLFFLDVLFFLYYYVPWMRCPLDYMTYVRRVPDGCVSTIGPLAETPSLVPAAPFDPYITQQNPPNLFYL